MILRTYALTALAGVTFSAFANAQLVQFAPNSPARSTQVNANFTLVKSLADAAQLAANAAQATGNSALATANGAQSGLATLNGSLGPYFGAITPLGNGNVGIGTNNPLNRLHVSIPGNGVISRFSGVDSEFRIHSFGPATGTSLVGTFEGRNGLGPQVRYVGGNAGNFIDIGQDQNGSFVVETNDNIRLAVRGDGNVGIGTDAPATRLHVAGGDVRMDSNRKLEFAEAGFNSDPIYIRRVTFGAANSNSSGLDIIIGDDPQGGSATDFFRIRTEGINGTNGQDRIFFTSDGQAYKASPGTGWGIISDRRLKRDIEPLEGALDKLTALRGHTYFYKDPDAVGTGHGQQMGFIAQEVEEVFPQWVTEFQGNKALQIAGFEALTVEALRELEEENARLGARVESLESMLEELQQSVVALQQSQPR